MIKKLKSNKTLILVFLCFLIFILSFLIHWYPLEKKGFTPTIGSETMMLAKNLYLTGEYKSENKIGTVLSSNLLREQGDDSVWGNKLDVIIYAQIFKIFGLKHDLPVYFSLILFSLTGVVLFLLTNKLFNLKIALWQAIIFMLLPIISYGSIFFGFYEWAIILFSLGLFLYLIKFDKLKNSSKINYFYLLLAGILFAVATLIKNSYLLSLVAIIIYDLLKSRNYKRFLLLFIPLVIGWLIYLAPDYLNNRVNSYISYNSDRYALYGHLFPDPYTFYFEKDAYLKNLIPNGPNDLEFLDKLQGISFKQKIAMYWASAAFYPLEALKVVLLGGPLILLFMIVGFKYLLIRRERLFKFFLFWIIGLYILLVIARTNNWDHFIEISFIISLTVALGCSKLIKFLKEGNRLFVYKKSWSVFFILAIIGHLYFANRWMYHERYESSNMAIIRNYANCIMKLPINQDVVAVALHPEFPSYLNYYTDKNYVRFDPKTLEKLMQENKLKEVFEKYQVKWIAGYSGELSNQIEQQGLAKVINENCQ